MDTPLRFWLPVAIAVLMLCPSRGWSEKASSETVLPVQTPAVIGVFIGEVKAHRSILLKFQTSGELAQINVVPGQLVKEGALLFELDKTKETYELASATARFRALDIELHRISSLVALRAAAQQQLTKLTADHEEALANLGMARESLRKRTLKAPFDGMVGTFDVTVGEVIQSEQSFAQLASLQSDGIYVELHISVDRKVSDWGRVTAEILNPENNLSLRIAPSTNVIKDGAYLIARTELVKNTTLKPGQMVQVRLIQADSHNFTISQRALINRDGKFFILTEDSANKKCALNQIAVLPTEVQVVDIFPDRVSVQGALPTGDPILLLDHLRLTGPRCAVRLGS